MLKFLNNHGFLNFITRICPLVVITDHNVDFHVEFFLISKDASQLLNVGKVVKSRLRGVNIELVLLGEIIIG